MWGGDDAGAASGETRLRYGPGRFDVISPGAYVTCAATGARIALEDLRYWSVEYQEAYASSAAALQRRVERSAPSSA